MLKKPNDRHAAGSKLVPIKIVLPFAIFSCVWIFSSDAFLKHLIENHQSTDQFILLRFLYLIVSSVFLYFLFRTATRHIRHSEDRMRLNEERLRQIIDLVPHFIFAKDMEGRFILVNEAVAKAYGTTVQDLIGKTDADFAKSDEEVRHFRQDDLEVIRSGKAKFIPEETITNAQGELRFLSTTKIPFIASGVQAPCILGVAVDVTERKHMENRLLALAQYDSLTTFPNRALFYERAGVGLSHARRGKTSCAVLFVDLDHFKSINDTLGHAIGDELIKDTAVKIFECIREMDTVARIGGDEFIVFLNSQEDAQSVQHIAERICEKFNGPRQILDNDLFVTASVGIATYPHDGKTLEDLLKNADIAMYAAKQAGRNGYCFFDSVMNTKAVNRMQIERGLRDALAKSEFRILYQPITRVKDGKVRGFEALLRWQRADGVLVAPGDFIGIAEETGMIVSIGQWVLKEACSFGQRLKDSGFDDMVMSVNISVAQLRRRDIVASIALALEETGLPAHCLEIEVTESICIDSFDASIDTLNQINQMGVCISLDDFGTGYSSLSQLQRLPITNLKIDRFFIQELAKEGGQTAMASAIIDLAHTLKLGVVAEGVEYDQQLQRLVLEHCDYFQGFLSAHPMPEHSAIDYLLSH